MDINENQEKRMKKLLIFSTKTLFNSNVFAELYSALCQTSKMVIFAKIINGIKSLIIFAKKLLLGYLKKLRICFCITVKNLVLFIKNLSFYRKKKSDLESGPD